MRRTRFLPRPIFVVRILFQMQKPQSLRLFDEWSSRFLVQQLPPGAELLGNLGVVHIRRHFGDLPPLNLRPDHEGIHGSLDVIGGLLALRGVGVGSGRGGVNGEGPEFGGGGGDGRVERGSVRDVGGV